MSGFIHEVLRRRKISTLKRPKPVESRRRFIVQGAVMFAIGVILTGTRFAQETARSIEKYLPPIRPPSASHDDAAFRAACIRCGLCGSVCENGCFARGEMGVRGLAPQRERYTGPLEIVVHRGDETIGYQQDSPTHPISTQGRSIYRKHLDTQLNPGDVVEVLPIVGWLTQPQRFEVPSPGVDTSVISVTIFALSGGLLFGGLLSLGLAIRPRTT